MKPKAIVYFIVFILGSNFAKGQFVLDAPFIYSNFHLFQPQPLWSFTQWEDGVFYTIPGSEKKEVFEIFGDHPPLYEWSYLYSEPEYIRSRVSKLIHLKKEKALSSALKKEKFYKTQDGDYRNKEGRMVKSTYHPMFFIRQFSKYDIGKINKDTLLYSRKRNIIIKWKSSLEAASKRGEIEYDQDGIRINPNYALDSILVFPFEDVLRKSIADGSLTAYTSKDYKTSISKSQAIPKLDSNKAERVILKEDYYRDLVTGEMTSSIIGLGLENEKGEEFIWFYFPELRWSLHYYYTIYNNEAIAYDYFFEMHYFKSKVLEVKHEQEYGLDRLLTDYAYSLKLDPEIAVQLRKEATLENRFDEGKNFFKQKGELKKLTFTVQNGKINGEVKEFHSNSKLSFVGKMKDGKPVGEYKFYFKNGALKAIRNYEAGLLQGNQINYYSNGTEYANYRVKNELKQYLKRQYEDGSLMEEGNCKDGLFIGKWEYHFKCSNEILELLKKYHEYFQTDNIKIDSNGFSYKVNYEWEFRNGTPPYVTLYHAFNVDTGVDFVK